MIYEILSIKYLSEKIILLINIATFFFFLLSLITTYVEPNGFVFKGVKTESFPKELLYYLLFINFITVITLYKLIKNKEE